VIVVNAPCRTLQVSFSSPEEFRHEYAANLLNGGVFIETDDPAEAREMVVVELRLAGCPDPVKLEGEIVHIVSPELSGTGAHPGVAVQFSCSPVSLRAAFEPFVAASGVPAPKPQDSGRRRAPRAPAQLPIRIQAGDAILVGHTRDLSVVGTMVSVRGDELPVGTQAQVTIKHPYDGDSLVCSATITRHLANECGVMALAIEFDPPAGEREALCSFVEELQSIEHTRRLGGIRGAITEIGIQNLLQMLGKTSPSGTLTLRCGDDEAIVGFESGLLRYVRLGALSGTKALVQVFSWSEGDFEFHARLEPVETTQLSMPLEVAILQATQLLDELNALDLGALSMDDRLEFQAAPVGRCAQSWSKIEQAVLDLAEQCFSVRRIVEVIPEPDTKILKAILFLVDLGTLSVSSK
jgi:Tfp pilus assembly protein PilZ